MAYSGGTPAARECIAKLSDLGALVDVYSNHWLESNPDFSYFTADELAEFQAKSQGACAGHMLIISTSLDDKAVSTLLPAAHAAFMDIVGPDVRKHKPDLIFINLATHQILYVGLGRKNQFFGLAIDDDGVHIRDGNIEDVVRARPREGSTDPTLVFMREFCEYDYAGVVGSLIEALYEFGVYARAWDYLPLTPDQIDEILDAGPNSDGLYDIDDELMTLEEAREVIAEFEEADEMGKENLFILQQFFTELTWGDLNTQDY